MRLRWLHLAEFAMVGDGDKPVVAGIFSAAFCMAPAPTAFPRPRIPLPYVFHAIANVEGSALDLDGHHFLEIRLVDADSVEVWRAAALPFRLSTPVAGIAPAVTMNVRMVAITVPDFGAYSLEVIVDGERLGETELQVYELTAAHLA